MWEERKRSGKRSYLNQFEQREDGSYVYAGSYRVCQLTREAYRREMGIQLLGAVISLILSVAAGCFTDTGMEGCFYLLLPYAGGLVVMILIVWSLVRMLHAGPRLRAYVYDKTAAALPRRTAFAMIFSGAALIGLLYAAITRSYSGRGIGAVLFVMSQCAEFLSSLLIRNRSRSIQYIEKGGQ